MAGNMRVCRFCLESDVTLLEPISAPAVWNNSVSSISMVIKNALRLLDIPYAPHDGYPNWMCGKCSQMLHLVPKFLATALQSRIQLDRQRMISKSPELKDFHTKDISILSGLVSTKHDRMRKEHVELTCEELLTNDDEHTDDILKEEIDIDYDSLSEEDYLAESLMLDEGVDEYYESFQEQFDNEIRITERATEESVTDVSPRRITTVSIERADVVPVHKKPERKHPGNGEETFPFCGIKSTSLQAPIRTHSTQLELRQTATDTSERRHQCGDCGKTFVWAKTLKAHQLTHTQGRKHGCTLCDKRFLFRWALLKHYRTHTGEKPFICTVHKCGKRFASSSNLRQHEKSHIVFEERKISCNFCAGTFVTKYNLRKHWKIRHGYKES